jgi:phage terminase small subunit
MGRSVIIPDKTYSAPLTAQQKKLATYVGRGMNWGQAALKAGYASEQTAYTLNKDPRVLALVAEEQKKHEAVVNMSREKVMNGFLEAVEIARLQAEPATMVKAWSEVARMCGYYAPETRKIDISISAKRLVDKFETMSDEELLKYAEKDIIDVEAKLLEAPESEAAGPAAE